MGRAGYHPEIAPCGWDGLKPIQTACAGAPVFLPDERLLRPASD